MKLILLENIYNLGDLGDTVTVRRGFGRNYLLPRGLAVPATPENLEKFEARRAELEAKANVRLATAQARAETVAEMGAVRFEVPVSPEGRLYGSINPHEIAVRLTELGFPLEKAEVDMPEGPIREPGEYSVGLNLHAEVQTTVEVVVVDENRSSDD